MSSRPEYITMLVLDVDGTLTDGAIWVGPGGETAKRFHVRDGFGIKVWQRAGFRVAVLSARSSDIVNVRAAELGIDLVSQGVSDKARGVRELAERAGVRLDAVAYLGDDWNDLPALQIVGYPMAVGDAEPQVQMAARFVTPRAGGNGAVRDAVEHLLSARGALAAAIAREIDAGRPG